MSADNEIRTLAAEYLKDMTAQETASQVEGQLVEPEPEVEEQAAEVEGQSVEEAEEQQQLFELKAAGGTHKLSLDEMKQLASKGLDYTKKTMELSERVKTEGERMVQERAAALDAKNRLLEAADTIEGLYGKPIATQEQLDQLIQDGDTETYIRVQRQEEKRKEILQLARNRRQEIIDAEAKAKQEQFHKDATNHTQLLFERMPELKESANQQKLAVYLLKSGLSNQEIETFIDHRGLIIAEKARRYDELSNGKTAPVKKDPPKVIKKVGASFDKKTYSQKEIEEATARLAKTGNLRDAAALELKIRQQKGA